jgi:hypothetical protein
MSRSANPSKRFCLCCAGRNLIESGNGLSVSWYCADCYFEWWYSDDGVLEYYKDPHHSPIKIVAKPVKRPVLFASTTIVHEVPEWCLLVLWERKPR